MSHLADFQPHPSIHPSSRTPGTSLSGKKQFKPLDTFTSLDANARVHLESYCVTDPVNVADPERLITLGRAGWYSLYSCKQEGSIYNPSSLLVFAGNKLLCTSVDAIEYLHQALTAGFENNPHLQLRLLPLLAVRLDLTAGPYTAEVVSLIASHLTILVDCSSDNSFLLVDYASEPILAAVSPLLLSRVGWARPSQSLCTYIPTAIVGPVSEGSY
jgi:hypothetical protein